MYCHTRHLDLHWMCTETPIRFNFLPPCYSWSHGRPQRKSYCFGVWTSPMRGHTIQSSGLFDFWQTCLTPCIYFLPNIHKAECPPPGSPIVSASGCPTERISALVDHFLSPYIPLLPSYIKDITDFLHKIEELTPLPSTASIFTMDVKFLFTNIPNIEALKVAKPPSIYTETTHMNPSRTMTLSACWP